MPIDILLQRYDTFEVLGRQILEGNLLKLLILAKISLLLSNSDNWNMF